MTLPHRISAGPHRIPAGRSDTRHSSIRGSLLAGLTGAQLAGTSNVLPFVQA